MSMYSQIKVAVGLSGGVDSSVTAYLLKEKGYQVTGVFMINWHDPNPHSECSVEQDLKDAEEVASKLGIPFITVDLSETYQEKVFKPFLKSYQQGLTPNPDVLCNRYVKFDAFLNHCLSLGFDKVATGHYARLTHSPNIQLEMAEDQNKDQTYFLAQVHQKNFKHAMFPLGSLLKAEVRDIAKRLQLNTANKKDSTGLCFIGEQPFSPFLNQFLLENPGPIVNIDTSKVIGQHQGLMFYTLGQRKGLGIGGQKNSQEPWFVARKDISSNTLFVAQGFNHPSLYANALSCDQIHWITSPPTSKLQCRIRHRQPLQNCTISLNNQSATVQFDTPQRSITPGQFIVFYHQGTCLGCAVITHHENS